MVGRSKVEEAQPIKQFKVKLNGHLWTIKMYTPGSFPDQTAWAFCHYDHKRKLRNIIFQTSKITPSLIAHELMHAYLSYKDLSTMSYGGIEEAVCMIFERHHKQLYNLIYKIYYSLKYT